MARKHYSIGMPLVDYVREYDGDDLTPLRDELHQFLAEKFQATRSQSMKLFYETLQVVALVHMSADAECLPDRALVVRQLERVIRDRRSLLTDMLNLEFGPCIRDASVQLKEMLSKVDDLLTRGDDQQTVDKLLIIRNEITRRLGGGASGPDS